NLVPWGIIVGGEELHNNHHSFATSAKLSAKWYEFDIGWMYIRLLEIVGLAKARRVIPTPRFTEAKSEVDLETLQAVITHRYDVMTRYVRSLRDTCGEELERIAAAGGKSFNPKTLRRLILSDSDRKVCEKERAQLEDVLRDNQALATIKSMREELAAIWGRSTASSEQLLRQLQDWIARAEQSGIEQLQEFSTRLRRYAL